MSDATKELLVALDDDISDEDVETTRNAIMQIKHVLAVDGGLDAPVLVQVQVPTWMKRRAMELADSQGKSLSDWFRDLLRTQTGSREVKRPKGGGR
jgi:hypothetical protein